MSIKDALKRAGMESTDDRLAQLIDQTIARHPREFHIAIGHLFGTISHDPAMVEHIFRDHAEAVLGPLIRHRMAEKSAARGQSQVVAQSICAARNHPASAGSRPGHGEAETHHRFARSASIPSQDGGGGQGGRATHRTSAPAANPPRIPAAAFGRAIASLLLDEIMPNGKRFRDCTKAELEDIGRRDGRRSHRCLAVAGQLTAPDMTPSDAGITEAELRRVDAAWNGE